MCTNAYGVIMQMIIYSLPAKRCGLTPNFLFVAFAKQTLKVMFWVSVFWFVFSFFSPQISSSYVYFSKGNNSTPLNIQTLADPYCLAFTTTYNDYLRPLEPYLFLHIYADQTKWSRERLWTSSLRLQQETPEEGSIAQALHTQIYTSHTN